MADSKVEIHELDVKEIKERLIRVETTLNDIKEKLTYLERLLTRVTARK